MKKPKSKSKLSPLSLQPPRKKKSHLPSPRRRIKVPLLVRVKLRKKAQMMVLRRTLLSRSKILIQTLLDLLVERRKRTRKTRERSD